MGRRRASSSGSLFHRPSKYILRRRVRRHSRVRRCRMGRCISSRVLVRGRSRQKWMAGRIIRPWEGRRCHNRCRCNIHGSPRNCWFKGGMKLSAHQEAGGVNHYSQDWARWETRKEEMVGLLRSRVGPETQRYFYLAPRSLVVMFIPCTLNIERLHARLQIVPVLHVCTRFRSTFV